MSLGTALTTLALFATGMNALYLQPNAHPSPMMATRPTASDLPQAGVTTLQRDPISAVLSASEAAGQDRIREAQGLLAARGLYEGTIDGIAGSATASAIMAFQREAAVPQTGILDEALLVRLRFANRRIPPPVARERALSEIPVSPGDLLTGGVSTGDPRILRIQQALADLGYAPGRPDGMVGEATRTAIKRFETDRGMLVTGEAGSALTREIERITGLAID